MAKILYGKEVTKALNARLASRAEALKETGVTPLLAIVRCGEDPSQMTYEKGAMKRAELTGVTARRLLLPETVSRDQLVREIRRLNGNVDVHGILLLRPLPKHLRSEENEICNEVSPEKDVDCMTVSSSVGVYAGKDIGFPPCTPQACIEILDHYGIDPAGKNIAVIGRSLVVGRPVAMMLLQRNATVTICHTKTKNVQEIARAADIIVSAAGAAGSLTKDCVRPGQIVIDVSIIWDPDKNDGQGGLTGDAVFDEVEPVVEAITPVPGGVGGVTTSVLMEHVITAAERLTDL